MLIAQWRKFVASLVNNILLLSLWLLCCYSRLIEAELLASVHAGVNLRVSASALKSTVQLSLDEFQLHRLSFVAWFQPSRWKIYQKMLVLAFHYHRKITFPCSSV